MNNRYMSNNNTDRNATWRVGVYCRLSKDDELAADICAGSGTTAIAAINAEHRFVCFETAPAFYAAASERIRAARDET